MAPERSKVTSATLQAMKDRNEKISYITAYDVSTARLVDEAGIEMILVGDSGGMTMLGYPNTLPVTMDEMIFMSKSVSRGAKHAFLVGDMPFLSYQADVNDAVLNAGRFIKEASMDAVKLEGGAKVLKVVRPMVEAGIPVQGHLGLTPQMVAVFGGFKAQGKSGTAALQLLRDALALEQAGCFSVLFEAIPARVATEITKALHVPTIGIGAGPGCDGQVLVYHDLFGLFQDFVPKFSKRYLNIGELVVKNVGTYVSEVKSGEFPQAQHTFSIEDQAFEDFLAGVDAVVDEIRG